MTTPPALTRLVLIRHGHPQAYMEPGVIAGPKGCTGLSSFGRAQVEALAARLKRTGEFGDAPVLVSSTLPRAIETAAAIAPIFDHPEWDQHCDLCEVHVGEELDGMLFADFEEQFGVSQKNIYEPWAPGVETWAEFVARTGRRLLALLSEHPGRTIVVACHGGVIDVSFRVLGDVALSRRFNAQPEYTSITEWVQGDAPGAPHGWSGNAAWRLSRYNDATHLEGVPPAPS